MSAGEGERGRSHPAGWAGQAGSLFETTIAEPFAHVGVVVSRNCENAEEGYYGRTDNRCS